MRHTSVTTLLTVLFLIGCNGSRNNSNSELRQQDRSAASKEPIATPEAKAFEMGEVIDFGDRKITIYGFVPHTEKMMKQVYGTLQGQAMDVLIENTSSSAFFISPLDFTPQDSEGRALTFYDLTPGGKRPNFPSERIAPGQRIRAYVTYADNKKPVEVYYKGSGHHMARVIVR